MLRPDRRADSASLGWDFVALDSDQQEREDLLLASPCPPPDGVLAHAEWLRAWHARCVNKGRGTWSRMSPHTANAANAAKAIVKVAPSLPAWARQQTAETRRSRMAPEITQAVEGYDLRTGLLLIAKTGRGKTVGSVHLLFTAWERTFRQGTPTPTAMFVKATDLGGARRVHSLGEGEPALLVKASEAPLLLLDDLGQDEKRDNSVFEVLDARYDAQLPTVVTSGFPLEELRARYGEALIRRIIETNGDGKIVNLLKPPAALRAAR